MASVAKAQTRRRRRTETGVVTAAHLTPKTIKVRIEYLVRHATYGKYLRRSRVLHAHDERQEAGPGDRVLVMECRPVSKTKTWRLVRVLQAAPKD